MASFIPQPIIDWRILSDTREGWKDIFGNTNAILLEVGFGRGEFILEQAQAFPCNNYIGIELMDFQNKKHRIDKIEPLIEHVRRRDLHNIRLIYNAQADIVIPQVFHNEEISEIFLIYPPPFKKPYPYILRLFWPPERGGNGFAQILYDALRFGGGIHIVTDSCDYANDILWNFENNINGKVAAGLSSHIPSSLPDSYWNDDGTRYYGQRYLHIRKQHTVIGL